MVAEHEGKNQRIWRLTGWRGSHSAGFRDSQQQPTGFVLMVALHQASIEDLNADPGAIATWGYFKTTHPYARVKGDLVRFWMARDTYQDVSPTQSLIFINFVHQYRLTAG